MRLLLPPERALPVTSIEDPLREYYRFPHRLIYRTRLSMALAFIGERRFGSLLEVGTGSGVFLPSLARCAQKLTAVDVHTEMAAVKRASDAAATGARFARADARSLPFRDASFDCVVCVSVLEFLGREERAVDELLRVTRRGGLVVAGFPVSNPLTGLMYEAIGNRRYKNTHRSSHRDIISAFRERASRVRVRRFPAWLPPGGALFVCVGATA